MKAFEYDWDFYLTDDPLVGIFNKRGADGWELVSVIPCGGKRRPQFECFWKREKKIYDRAAMLIELAETYRNAI